MVAARWRWIHRRAGLAHVQRRNAEDTIYTVDRNRLRDLFREETVRETETDRHNKLADLVY